MPHSTKTTLVLSLALALLACDPAAAPVDAGSTVDSGLAGIDRLAIDEELDLERLDGEVDVVYDDRGIPHIYGTTMHDVLLVEGYLMSRDRFAEMEFIRRNVLGRLAEVAGSLSPSLLEDDYDNRVNGYARMGRRIWDSLQASTEPGDVRARESTEAFVDGINQYIARTRTVPRGEEPSTRGSEAFDIIVGSPFFTDWEPADIFAMARFQAMELSYDPGDDAGNSRALAAVLAAFPAGDPRHNMFLDLFGELPARAVFTRDGFNDGTTSALAPDFRPRPVLSPMTIPPLSTLDGARPFFDRMEARSARIGLGDEHRGSNNWIVGGSLTASGHPILSNDPHLALIAPGVWWYVHLNTARMGGEGNLDAEGVAFNGLPGIVLGFNRDIAWGTTTTGYDVTDGYLEEITAGTGGAPDTVLFDADGDGDLTNATQVAIVTEMESINVAGMPAPVVRPVEFVPHHGVIIPGSRQPVAGMPGRFTALSVRYTGFDVSNELGYFVELLTATSVAEAAAAQSYFRVGNQNWVVIDNDEIRWSSGVRIPTRDDRATDLVIAADGTMTGDCPNFVLSGSSGEHEWTGDLDLRFVPHDEDPARGWIATANQDNVGVTADGNVCNDPYFLGGGFEYGWREDHIAGRLTELATTGGITVADMQELQALTTSSTGTLLRDPIVAILGDATAIADLGLSTADQTRLSDARTRLMAWSLETPHGVGATAAAEIADSVATTIWNAAITRIIPRALSDELTAAGIGTGSDNALRWLEFALTSPDSFYALDAGGESALWDDVSTAAATETREEIVIRGTLAGLDFLSTELGMAVDEWRWGRLHTVSFDAVVPALSADVVSIPPEGDPLYDTGFPRHGDYGAVDVGNFGMFAPTNFSHGSGASQRFVVEMLADGPHPYNALPGGQSIDPESPHHADEAALWIANEAPEMSYREADVVLHAERRVHVR